MKYLNRVRKQVKLSNDEWDTLIDDLSNGLDKNIILAKYGINSFQYKQLKKYFIGT